MRKLLIPTLAALLAAAFTAGVAVAGNGPERKHQPHAASYAVGLWDDLPYAEGGTTPPTSSGCTARSRRRAILAPPP